MIKSLSSGMWLGLGGIGLGSALVLVAMAVVSCSSTTNSTAATNGITSQCDAHGFRIYNFSDRAIAVVPDVAGCPQPQAR